MVKAVITDVTKIFLIMFSIVCCLAAASAADEHEWRDGGERFTRCWKSSLAARLTRPFTLDPRISYNVIVNRKGHPSDRDVEDHDNFQAHARIRMGGEGIRCAELSPGNALYARSGSRLRAPCNALPYLIPHFWTARTLAGIAVVIELFAINLIQNRCMETPWLRAALQVLVGGSWC